MKPDGTGRGYVVTAEYRTHQVAVAVLSAAGTAVTVAKTLVDPSTSVDHVDVRIAPYGKKNLLLSYETVAARTCNDLATGTKGTKGTCLGTFTGTHLRLLTLTGRPVGAAVVVPERIVGQVGVLADGDLVWAYAPVTPDYSAPIYSPSGACRTLDVALLKVP
jgi:hypothetical protein